MRVMFELLLISVDLCIVHPNEEQFCELQPECCIVSWKGNDCSILIRRAGTHHLLKIRPLPAVSSWQSKGQDNKTRPFGKKHVFL